MTQATERPPTIAELKALLAEQQKHVDGLLRAQREELCASYEARFTRQAEQIARQEERIESLCLQIERPAGTAGKRAGTKGISRASLLKGAAAGVAGLAAAELSGTLSATPSFATTTDTNLVATGGSGTGVQVGGQSATDYGYSNGGWFDGSSFGVAGYAVDSTGAANGGIGVHGQSGSGSGVYGYSSSGNGVYGNSDGGNGVNGLSTIGDAVHGNSQSGNGVHGLSSWGIGVQGYSFSYLGGWFGGGQAPIFLQPAGAAGPPSTGAHYQGEIMIDNTGVPYVCSAGNGTNLGTWQAIGNFRSFPNPRRVYQNTGVIDGSNYPNIDATKRLNSTASGVPAGASAAYCAVQATPSSANARLAIGPNDNTFNGGIANFTAPVQGALNLVYMLVALASDGKFQFTSYLAGAVYVDVWGFML